MAETKTYGGYIYARSQDGSWVRQGPAQPQMPSDPAFPYQGPQAAASAKDAGATAAVNAATVPAQIDKTNREASTAGLPEGWMWEPGGSGVQPIPGYSRQGLSPEVRSKAMAQWGSAKQLDRTIAELENLYQEGPGKTGSLRAIEDYLPLTSNERFNTAANAARGIVRNALGLTGGESNTATEAQMNLGAYIPQASNRDKTIEDSIQRLRDLSNLAREQAVRTLGGEPDENGNITPVPQPNAMTINRILSGPEVGGAAAFGAESGADAIPPEMQAENKAWLAQNLGNFDPRAYAQFRTDLDKKYGFPATSFDTYQQWAEGVKQQLAAGGATVSDTIPAPERDLSTTEWLRNSAASNPVGAAFVGAADMGGFGGVSALAGDKATALADEYPTATTIGQVLGSIGATEGLGWAGRGTIGKLAPKTLGGGAKADFARNLATDATYGGIYGEVTEGDPLRGAAYSAVSSALGQGAGKTLGATIGGVARSAPAQTLKDYMVNAPIGSGLGKIPKALEDAATSVPIVGDLALARRGEAFNDFNRATFKDAGEPIGFVPNAIGQAGVDQLSQAVSSAYDSATAGVDVPLDKQFGAGLMAARQLADKLPTNVRPDFDQMLQNEIGDIATTGRLTGETYQQAMRGLKMSRKSPPNATFEQQWKDATTAAMDALEQQMRRGGGDSVVTGLNKANDANRRFKTVKDAVTRARHGTQSGEIQTFVPSQLNDAAYATEKKYPGPRPFADLADAGQQVLPSKIPDSGTGRRVAQMALGTSLLGAGAGGAGYATGDYQTPATTALTLGTLLALGGTKAGQKTLGAMLFERPQQAQKLGDIVNRNAYYLGHAALPLSLPQGG